MSRMLRNAEILARRFAGDRRGAVAVIFIVALVPLIAAGGAAIDISRAYLVQQRLGMAIDAAGLAIGSSTGTDSELQQKMTRFFNANYPANEIGVPATPVMAISGNRIQISATASVDATLMKIVGINTITVSANTEVIREISGLEVALVLDVTGSMNTNNRIGAMRDAATTLVNTLYDSSPNPASIRIALVPFVTTVNVGTANMGWIDTTGAAQHNGENFNPRTSHLTLFNNMNRAWKGCVEARPAPYDTDDTPPDASIPNTLFVPYFWPDEPNTSGQGYNNSYMNDGVTGSDATRQASIGKYGTQTPSIDDTPSDTRGPNKSCGNELLPLTNDRTLILNRIAALRAWNNGGTVGSEGLAWGWRALSPGEPLTQGAPYGDQTVAKAVVFLTDGENQAFGQDGNMNRSDYGGYGYLARGRLGTTTSKTVARQNIDAKVATLCQNIKNLGISLYTITFEVSGSAAPLMQACASSPSQYFDSPTTSELEGIFRTIANQLSNLRLGR
jgi:Flp pilus assembly protein TadG